MSRWGKSARVAFVAGLLVLGGTAPLAAAPACDEYDPFGPSRSTQLRLGPGDLVEERGDELRSFVVTDSIGKVDVAVVSSSPRGIVRSVSAVPDISMMSLYHGEKLKGIRVAVSVGASRRPVSVVLSLRQVCAKQFRNTFLYY